MALTVASSPAEIRLGFPRLSDKEIADNKRTFAALDADKDGLLNEGEFKAMVKSFGFRTTPEKVDALFKELSNGGHGVSFTVFLRHHLEKDLRKKRALKDSFKFVSAMASGASPAHMFEKTVDRFANKTGLIFEGNSYTFRQMDDSANQMANYLIGAGLKKGDIVALDMENRPEYFTVWLGVAKAAGSSALINSNLKDKSLLHCVKVSDAKILVFGIEVADKVAEVAPALKASGMRLLCFGGKVDFAESLDADLARSSKVRPPVADVSPDDCWAFIYTSGTTGLPKAAYLKNSKFWGAASFFATQFELRPDDVVYNCLPLYHSAGGMICTGLSFFTGATMVIKRKFSVSAFWEDVRTYQVTVFQYIGELCRYLMTGPPSPLDSKNNLRMAIGNGLRPDIWEEFQTRFAIPEIGEFYSSTEGNASLWHIVSGPEGRGAIGHRGKLMDLETNPLVIVKFDVEKEAPIRNAKGFCIPVAKGEAGELLGQIIPGNSGREFVGYHGNKEGTEKKILRDVFVKGDIYFRTGDLIREDSEGYQYFVDRIGDTYRWKGENVSTNEVAEILSQFPGIQEVNVYGVQIKGYDGRAGMAAIVASDNLDLNKFGQYAAEKLPSYAVPLFLRKLSQISITGTFKHQKVELRNQGVNPSTIKDPIYVFDANQKRYIRFTPAQHDAIISNKARL